MRQFLFDMFHCQNIAQDKCFTKIWMWLFSARKLIPRSQSAFINQVFARIEKINLRMLMAKTLLRRFASVYKWTWFVYAYETLRQETKGNNNVNLFSFIYQLENRARVCNCRGLRTDLPMLFIAACVRQCAMEFLLKE